MLDLRPRRAHRRPPNRKLVPSNPLGEGGGRLEGRSMAAPALWMQPFPPGGFLNQATGTVNATEPRPMLPPICASGWGQGLFSGIGTATLINDVPTITVPNPNGGPPMVFPGVTYTMTGYASARVIDLSNPGNGSGFANIGNYGVSALTSNVVTWSTVGNISSPTVFDTMNTTAAWSRAYFLADSDQAPAGSPPGTWTNYAAPNWLVENYSVTYAGPGPNQAVVVNGGAGVTTGPVPGGGGLTVQSIIAGNTIGIVNLRAGGLQIPLINDLAGGYSASFYSAGMGARHHRLGRAAGLPGRGINADWQPSLHDPHRRGRGPDLVRPGELDTQRRRHQQPDRRSGRPNQPVDELRELVLQLPGHDDLHREPAPTGRPDTTAADTTSPAAAAPAGGPQH